MPSSVTPRNSMRADSFGSTQTVSLLRRGFAVGSLRRMSGLNKCCPQSIAGGIQPW